MLGIGGYVAFGLATDGEQFLVKETRQWWC